tara:strand:- start:1586 stop:1741 length:156 start_codon:yes stop_codon:yes gene_type:complete
MTVLRRLLSRLKRKRKPTYNDGWYDGFLFAQQAAAKRHPRAKDGTFLPRSK